jgi:hypothetical protein
MAALPADSVSDYVLTLGVDTEIPYRAAIQMHRWMMDGYVEHQTGKYP